MVGRPYTYSIENVVATCSIGRRLDLDKISRLHPGVKYDPENFSGLVFHLKRPKSATLIFRSGKLINTGTKCVDDAKKAIKIVLNKLKSVYEREIKTPEIIIQNIVASGRFHGDILLEELYGLPQRYRYMYEPDQFPAAVVRDTESYLPNEGMRILENQGVFLLFANSSFVCTGCKYEESVELRVEDMYNILLDTNLLQKETS